jgi:hypothetical protein
LRQRRIFMFIFLRLHADLITFQVGGFYNPKMQSRDSCLCSSKTDTPFLLVLGKHQESENAPSIALLLVVILKPSRTNAQPNSSAEFLLEL